MKLRSGLLLLVLAGAPPASAQEIQGVAVSDTEAPVLLADVSAAEGGFFDPQGVRIVTGLFNVTDRWVRAVEFKLFLMTPWNELRYLHRETFVGSIDPGEDHLEPVQFPYLGKRDVLSVVGIVTKVRFADGEVWVADEGRLAGLLSEAVSGFDFSAVPGFRVSRRLEDRPGAYAFTELRLSDRGWTSPTVEGQCVTHGAAEGAAVSLTLEDGGMEFLELPAGGRLTICGNVAHVDPGTPRRGS